MRLVQRDIARWHHLMVIQRHNEQRSLAAKIQRDKKAADFLQVPEWGGENPWEFCTPNV